MCSHSCIQISDLFKLSLVHPFDELIPYCSYVGDHLQMSADLSPDYQPVLSANGVEAAMLCLPELLGYFVDNFHVPVFHYWHTAADALLYLLAPVYHVGFHTLMFCL